MSGNRYIRRGGRSPVEPKIGRMLLVSLGLHLLLFIVFSGVLVFNGERDRRPVYYVDLTQPPVANPQAGRPDARPKTTKKTVKKTVKKAVTKRVKKTPVKKVTKIVKATVPPIVSPADIQKKLAAMQRKQEREDLKAKLAALAIDDSRNEDALDVDAPLGMTDGQGDEVGVSQQAYLQAFIKSHWSLSRYQVSNRDLSTRLKVVYSRTGQLVKSEILESSGEAVFDTSVKMAILKGRQLPFEPPHDNWTQVINFNLKDLLDQ